MRLIPARYDIIFTPDAIQAMVREDIVDEQFFVINPLGFNEAIKKYLKTGGARWVEGSDSVN